MSEGTCLLVAGSVLGAEEQKNLTPCSPPYQGDQKRVPPLTRGGREGLSEKISDGGKLRPYAV
jgi:hypothetical protein